MGFESFVKFGDNTFLNFLFLIITLFLYSLSISVYCNYLINIYSIAESGGLQCLAFCRTKILINILIINYGRKTPLTLNNFRRKEGYIRALSDVLGTFLSIHGSCKASTIKNWLSFALLWNCNVTQSTNTKL